MAYSRKKSNFKRYLKRRKFFEIPPGKRIELRRNAMTTNLSQLLMNSTCYKGFHISLQQKGDGFISEVRLKGIPCFEGELSKVFESKDWAFNYACNLIDGEVL